MKNSSLTDDRLTDLLRTAVPPVAGEAPARDVWPDIAEGLNDLPRWSYVDLSLAAAVVLTLFLFPEWLMLLAYHL